MIKEKHSGKLKNCLICPQLSRKRIMSLISMSKSDLKFVVGTITGQCNIRTLASKWDGDDTYYCKHTSSCFLFFRTSSTDLFRCDVMDVENECILEIVLSSARLLWKDECSNVVPGGESTSFCRSAERIFRDIIRAAATRIYLLVKYPKLYQIF